jgi:hypothetical protein
MVPGFNQLVLHGWLLPALIAAGCTADRAREVGRTDFPPPRSQSVIARNSSVRPDRVFRDDSDTLIRPVAFDAMAATVRRLCGSPRQSG